MYRLSLLQVRGGFNQTSPGTDRGYWSHSTPHSVLLTTILLLLLLLLSISVLLLLRYLCSRSCVPEKGLLILDTYRSLGTANTPNILTFLMH